MSYTISTIPYSYKDKREKRIKESSIIFKRVETDIYQLADYIQKGYAITHNFGLDELRLRDKTIKNFRNACFISLDVDNCPIRLEDTIEALDKKPTISYYTASNGYKGEGFRFRLIYLFDDLIDVNHYKPLTASIDKYLRQNVEGYENEDNCSMSCAQYYYGADPQEVSIFLNADYVYHLNDFPHEPLDGVDGTEKFRLTTKRKKQEELPNTEFFTDLEDMDYWEFMRKYEGYKTQYHSPPIEYDEANGVYIYDKENYIEIIHRFKTTKDRYGNKRRVICKIRDGENRRKWLFHTACNFRLIDPMITVENLVINLLKERDYCYDNSDNVLNNECIAKIALGAMRIPQEKLRNDYKGRKKGFSVNKQFCKDYNLNVRGHIQSYKRKILYDKIKKVFNSKLTYKENQNLCKDYGIDVSISTLKRAYQYFLKSLNKYSLSEEPQQTIIDDTSQKRRKNGIPIHDIAILYNRKKSVKENLASFHRLGIQIGKDKLYQFCKQNGINTSPNKKK